MARKPYVVTAAGYYQHGVIRSRIEVTGSTGTVTVTVEPDEGAHVTSTYDLARLTARFTGAPRGWDLIDPTGGHHVLPTLSDVSQWAVRWATSPV